MTPNFEKYISQVRASIDNIRTAIANFLASETRNNSGNENRRKNVVPIFQAFDKFKKQAENFQNIENELQVVLKDYKSESKFNRYNTFLSVLPTLIAIGLTMYVFTGTFYKMETKNDDSLTSTKDSVVKYSDLILENYYLGKTVPNESGKMVYELQPETWLKIDDLILKRNEFKKRLND